MIRGTMAPDILVGATMIPFIRAGIPGMATAITHHLTIITPMASAMVMGIHGMATAMGITADTPAWVYMASLVTTPLITTVTMPIQAGVMVPVVAQRDAVDIWQKTLAVRVPLPLQVDHRVARQAVAVL